MNRLDKYNNIALATGSLIFLAIVYYLGPSAVLAVLKKTRLSYLPLTLPLFLLSNYIRIYKWITLRDRMASKISFAQINAIFFSSKFWGMVSPMRSGEAVPALINPENRGSLLSIILYDRIIETFQTLLVFGCLFFVFYGVLFKAGTGVALAGILVVLIFLSVLIFRRDAGEFVFSLVEKTLQVMGGSSPVRALSRLALSLKGEMEVFYAATRSYLSFGLAVWLLLLSFLSWGVDIGVWAVICKAMGLEVPLYVLGLSVALTSMVAALSPTPAGLGVADLGFVAVLGYLGYAVEAGGVIILLRLLVHGYFFLAYLIFGIRPVKAS